MDNSQLDVFTLYYISSKEILPKNAVGPSTAISRLLIYPLDLVITRLQAQEQFHTDDKDADYKGVRDALEKIYKNEGGIRAFYRGFGEKALKEAADSFLFFLAYTYIGQKRLTARGLRKLSTVDEIGVGVLAGAFSKFWTTPIENLVTRKQTAAMMDSHDVSVKDISHQIRHDKGLQGFWSGYSASLILTLNPSITLLLYKALVRLLVPRARRSDPGARITFLLVAISKALASTVTYPFALAKTRAQVSSQKPWQTTEPRLRMEKAEDTVETGTARARWLAMFNTILHVAKTEGLLGLYQGLGAEVFKVIISYGIAMLAKDRIRTVNLYYLILKALKNRPRGAGED